MAKASDNPYPSVLLVEQASAPATPAAGQARIYRGTDNKNYIIDDAGTSTEIGAGGGGVFSAWTPALTAATTNPTLGTGGSTSGRYTQSGKKVSADAVVQFGTTGMAAGTGTYLLSLPVNASTAQPFAVLGVAYMYDSSAGQLRTAVVTRNSATQAQFAMDGGLTAPASSSVPWAWSASDVIVVHYEYEAA